ncbi:MAG: molybdopterin-dependent oxidoreductase [Deltaproteobacteria bacterium]|nr:molybdopterin-dependent oxidoreductase [Deltaproteobacteria bacterium]
MNGKKIIRSTCKACHGGCGVLVTVENGVVTYLEGDPDSPTRGTMCAKGLSSIQHMNHPDRLTYPLKRVGERGEGKWERISWDEALDTIGNKMKGFIEQYGPNSVCNSQGTGRGYGRYTVRLGNSYGTGNRGLGTSHICYFPRLKAFEAIFGVNRLYCDYHGWGGEYPKTQISWAKQIEHTNADGEMAVWFLDSLKHAKNLIVVDPRATSITNQATLWLQIRPGTDAALAMGMLNIIIYENLYDKEFVNNWCDGFDKLKDRVREFTPEKVSEITWIPKEKIIQAARIFALEKPGCIQTGEPLDAIHNSHSNALSIIAIMAITGNVERPGSMMCWVPPDTGPMEVFHWEIADNVTKENLEKGIGRDKYKFRPPGFCHTETVLRQLREGNCAIRMLHQHGGNFLFSLTNTKNVYKSLLNLEFISIADQFMSTFCEIADIVLPVAHWLEEDDIWDMHPGFMVRANNKAVEPPGEARSTAWIYLEIGKRVAPKFWPWETVEDMLNYQLRKADIKWEDFKEIVMLARTGKDQPYYKYKTDYWRKGGGFPTKTGKVELCPTMLEDLGYDPLPYYEEPCESYYSTPELAEEYPLILNTGGRVAYNFHTQFTNLPWIREMQHYPRVQIHPDTAREYGIEEGDWVWIESLRGRIRQKANLFAGMDPRIVVVQAGFCYWEKKGHARFLTSNANVLTDDAGPFDVAIGSSNYRALLCKIYKVKDGDPLYDPIDMDN